MLNTQHTMAFEVILKINEVVSSVEMVTLTCMIDITGNISSFKLLNPYTKDEIKENEYSPFQRALVKGLANTKKWIPAHLMNVPIAFPISIKFRVPRNFYDQFPLVNKDIEK